MISKISNHTCARRPTGVDKKLKKVAFLTHLVNLFLLIVSPVYIKHVVTTNNVEGGATSSTQTTITWTPIEDSWNYWWSYSGVSGPSYWGLLNLDWFMCDRGLRQSPINIETHSLVYDGRLTPLKIDNNLIAGVLYNDGHSVVFNGSLMASRLSSTAGSLNGQTNGSNGDEITNNNNNDLSLAQKLSKRHAKQDEQQLGGGSLFSPVETQLVLDDSFLITNKPNESTGHEDDEDNLNVNDLSKSVEISIRQSNQLSSRTILENELDRSDSKLQDGSSLAAVAGDSDSDSDSNSDSNQDEQESQTSARVYLSGAGLAYRYQFEALYLRFGQEANGGSEHQINSRSYAAELQLMSFNSHLYKSYMEASTRPNGLLAISVLVDIVEGQLHDDGPNKGTTTTTTTTNRTNRTAGQLDKLLRHLPSIGHRGASKFIQDLRLTDLLPETDQFVTYEGSLSQPGCHESVNWLLLNKPLYITRQNLDRLRSLSADEQSVSPSGTFLAGNLRPTQPVNGRPIRTNIRPPSSGPDSGKLHICCCSVGRHFEDLD